MTAANGLRGHSQRRVRLSPERHKLSPNLPHPPGIVPRIPSEGGRTSKGKVSEVGGASRVEESSANSLILYYYIYIIIIP